MPQDAGYRDADMVRLDIQVNGEPVDALSVIVHRSEAVAAGRDMASKLKELMSRQLFEVAIQAAVGGKVRGRPRWDVCELSVVRTRCP